MLPIASLPVKPPGGVVAVCFSVAVLNTDQNQLGEGKVLLGLQVAVPHQEKQEEQRLEAT